MGLTTLSFAVCIIASEPFDRVLIKCLFTLQKEEGIVKSVFSRYNHILSIDTLNELLLTVRTQDIQMKFCLKYNQVYENLK